MLFDPRFVLDHPLLLLAGLAIVLIGKPLAALIIVEIIGYPLRTALAVAVGLAQVGEFSFILADLGRKHGLLDEVGNNLIVACAIVSITINPLLFRAIDPIERRVVAHPALARILNWRAARRQDDINAETSRDIARSDTPLAVIVGYGPVGQTVDEILRKTGLETLVIDLNMDTITRLQKEKRLALYGDAYNVEIMHEAFPRATHLVITLSHSINRNPLIAAAKLINPNIKIIVRARYLSDREDLERYGADQACFEEAEAAVALAKLVLFDRGADPDAVRRETIRIRQALHDAATT
jgi:CPA2 family monovalent cation:H+ antiporter-2